MAAIGEDWTDRLQEWALSSGVRILAVVAGALVIYWLARLVTRKLLHVARRMGDGYVSRDQEVRARTLGGIVRSVLLAVIIVIAALMILKELGYDIGPLIAGAGIAGLAIGFGAQTLIRDLIGGFFVLLEGQYNVGDWVEVQGGQRAVAGTVEEVRMRTTLLRDVEGTLHIVPNGEIRIASNYTRGWARAVIDIDIYYKEDIARVIKLLEGVCRRAATDLPVSGMITEGPVVQGVQGLSGRNVTVRVVATTEPYSKMDVARGLRREIISELDRHGVAMGRGRFPGGA